MKMFAAVWMVCALAGGVASLDATVLVPVGLGELARDAPLIVRGRVVAVEAQWVEGGSDIETLVTLEVETYLKGGTGPSLRFRVSGGQIGRLRRIVSGAPQFQPGQRVIVFLDKAGSAAPHILGFNQGVFRVHQSGSRWVVSPAAFNLGPAAGPRTRAPGAPSLADFEREVRALMGAAQ